MSASGDPRVLQAYIMSVFFLQFLIELTSISVRDADHSACNACGVSCTQRRLEESSTNIFARGTHRYVTTAEGGKKRRGGRKRRET